MAAPLLLLSAACNVYDDSLFGSAVALMHPDAGSVEPPENAGSDAPGAYEGGSSAADGGGGGDGGADAAAVGGAGSAAIGGAGGSSAHAAGSGGAAAGAGGSAGHAAGSGDSAGSAGSTGGSGGSAGSAAGSGGSAGSAAGSGGSASAASCSEPGGAVWSGDGHCYFLLSAQSSWSVSRDDCGAAGAHLVTISSAEEQSFVGGIAGSSTSWIGLAKFGAPSFSWYNGEAFDYTNWAFNEPNQSGEAAVALQSDTHAWIDDAVSANHAALCERE